MIGLVSGAFAWLASVLAAGSACLFAKKHPGLGAFVAVEAAWTFALAVFLQVAKLMEHLG